MIFFLEGKKETCRYPMKTEERYLKSRPVSRITYTACGDDDYANDYVAISNKNIEQKIRGMKAH